MLYGSASQLRETLDIELPEGIKVIGDEAFYACKDLENINIPDGLSYFGRDVYKFCTKMGYGSHWDQTRQMHSDFVKK